MKNEIVKKMESFIKNPFERTTIDTDIKGITTYKNIKEIEEHEELLEALPEDISKYIVIKMKTSMPTGISEICYIPSVKYIVYPGNDSSIYFIDEDFQVVFVFNADNLFINIKTIKGVMIALETCEIPISYYDDINNNTVDFPKTSLRYKVITNNDGSGSRELNSVINIFLNPFSYPITIVNSCKLRIPYNNADMQYYYYVKTLCDQTRFRSNYDDHYISIGDYVVMDSIKTYEIVGFNEDNAILKAIISNGKQLVDVPLTEIDILKVLNNTEIYRKDKVSMIFGEQILFNGNISSLKEFRDLHSSIVNIMTNTTQVAMQSLNKNTDDKFLHDLITDIYELLNGDWKTLCNNKNTDLLLFMNGIAPINVRDMLMSSVQSISTSILPSIEESIEAMILNGGEEDIKAPTDIMRLMVQCLEMLEQGEEISPKL